MKNEFLYEVTRVALLVIIILEILFIAGFDNDRTKVRLRGGRQASSRTARGRRREDLDPNRIDVEDKEEW